MSALTALGRLPLTLGSGFPSARRLLIFTFHRVLERSDPLLGNEPGVAEFDALCRYMADYLNVLPLPEAVDMLQAGQLPPRAAVITFDDGYRNNAELAAPILKQYGLTASFFVCTGAVDRGAMWNDLVIESIRRASGPTLSLKPWGLEPVELKDLQTRRAGIKATLAAMKYRPLEQRLDESQAIFQAAAPGERCELMMSPDMILNLQRAGHDIGGHTVNHPILASLTESEAREEITENRHWLESLLDRKPKTFAYPNGQPGKDFTEVHEAMVRETGYQCAVSTRWGAAARNESLWALSRFAPWERGRSGFWFRLVKTYLASHTGAER